MKHIKLSVLSAVAAGAMMALALLGGASLPEAKAATLYQTTFNYSLTNLPTYVTGGATSNLTTTPITVKHGFAIAVMPYFAGTNAVTTNTLTLNWAGSQDGTNYATTNYISSTYYPNGATGTRGLATLPATSLDGLRSVKLVSVVNGNASTNGIYLTNIVASYGN